MSERAKHPSFDKLSPAQRWHVLRGPAACYLRGRMSDDLDPFAGRWFTRLVIHGGGATRHPPDTWALDWAKLAHEMWPHSALELGTNGDVWRFEPRGAAEPDCG